MGESDIATLPPTKCESYVDDMLKIDNLLFVVQHFTVRPATLQKHIQEIMASLCLSDTINFNPSLL